MTTIINVKNAPYSAVGNGVTDDTLAIQKALDTAFGGPSTTGTNTTPNGSNCTANMTVYFPAGNYLANSLNVNKLVGGRIFGDNSFVSTITWNAGAPSPGSYLFRTNGSVGSVIENLGFSANGQASSNLNVFDFDWDGITTNGGGLNGNRLYNLFFYGAGTTAATVSLNIAKTGAGGTNNLFLGCVFSGCGIGTKITGASASGNRFVDCDWSDGAAPLIWVAAGTNASFSGCQWSTSVDGALMKLESGTILMAGCRSEQPAPGLSSWNWVNITGGTLAMFGCGVATNGSSGKGFIDMASPASVYVDAISDGGGTNGKIAGTGTLEIRNPNFQSLADPTVNISGFSGTLTRWRLPTSTKAGVLALTSPKAGMEVNITDGDNISLTFNANLTADAAGGTRLKTYAYSGASWLLKGV